MIGAETAPHPISPLEGEMPGRAEGGIPATTANRQRLDDLAAAIRSLNKPYRFKLPKIPRTIARPTWVATVRVTLFIAASMIVSRW